MILLDFSGTFIATYLAVGAHNAPELDFLRHLVYTGIASVNAKFRHEYGEMVIAIDSKKGSWRRKVFPYYKENRKEDQAKSSVDWKLLKIQLNTILNEIREILPYKIIEVDHSEADDIIGVMARYCVKTNEKCLIVSRDKDFVQLQIGNDVVSQWDNPNEKFVGAEDPKKFLFEHIIRGDRGDGIPNILSSPDSLVTKTRQKSINQKKFIDVAWEDMSLIRDNPAVKERFNMNLRLIDLNFTPQPIKDQALDMYLNSETPRRGNLYKYFIAKGLSQLMTRLGDF